jgi:LacI family transcriptional regulator
LSDEKDIKSEATGGASGERAGRSKQKLTINDIAKLAGVSKKTVSRVINKSPRVREETRKRIQDIIEKHDFSPDLQARALAFRRSFLIAMIYDNPSPQYVVNMQRGILDTLEDTDLQLLVRPVDRNDPRFFEKLRQFLEERRLFGAILPPSVSEDDGVAELLQELNCPYVRIASMVLDMPSRMVVTRDSEGGAEAARHIAALGHKRIGHIRGPAAFKSSHERLRGFKEGLAEHGVELDANLVVEAGYTYDTGYEAAKKLLSLPDRPTAVFAGNDEMAFGIYQAAKELKLKIPRDLSVVSFDDTPIAARVEPAMTSVRLPIREMGKRAAELLMAERGATPVDEGQISFVPELIVRESTSKPK